MGLLGKLFDKKICCACGGEIGLLGNRKLEDGNLCKKCAEKLSPWFSERRHSTVEEILGQLDYREMNRGEVTAFHTTRTLGKYTKVLIDENQGKFMVTSARKLEEANPDVIRLADITGIDIDIEESSYEIEQPKPEPQPEPEPQPQKPGGPQGPQRAGGPQGPQMQQKPQPEPRRKFHFDYNFYIKLHVNHPYFDEIRFKVDDVDVDNVYESPRGGYQPDPRETKQYQEIYELESEIKARLEGGAYGGPAPAEAPAQTAYPVICPWCGASTKPTAGGCCEYCGGGLQ